MSLFFLIYRYMFGGAIHVAGIATSTSSCPGFIATGVLFSGIGTATAMAEDLEQGFVDRLRSLPIPRSSVLAARAIADTAIFTWSTAFTIAIAFAVGFRLHGTAAEGLAAFGLVVAFGFAFEWVFITLGLVAGNAQAAQGMGMIVFPFAFISSAYVPVDSMPGWLQAFAEHQPLTSMVDAVRALTLGPQAERAARPPRVVLRRARARVDGGDRRRRVPARRGAVPPRLTRRRTPSYDRARARPPRSRRGRRGVTAAPLVRSEADAGVARVTLDSPSNRNALSAALLTQLNEALDASFADPAVRVIVLSGTGPVFSSGADLKEQREYRARGEPSPVSELLAAALTRVLESPKPVVARVNGHARAGGLGLIGAADIAIAPAEATFGFAEVRLGVVPAVIAVTTVPRMTARAALELFLTGETFDGRRAVEVGLLNRVVPAEELDAEVERYVGMLRRGGPEALRHIKPMLARVRELPQEEAFRAMAALSAERFASDEGQEGMRAFAERRDPPWTGA